MADYRKSLMDMTPEERADVAPGFVPSDDVSTPLSVKVADEAVSLATPIDSIVEIQEELKKENPDYLKIGMLGGIEAISLLAPGAGKAAQSMIRKGADMARQTDDVVDVASNVPKVAKNKPEEFSGTLPTRHGFTGDRPTEFLPRGEYKGQRYDSTGGTFGDKPLYLEDPENPFFLTDDGVVAFSYDDVTDVDASFDRAFILTPETVGTLKNKVGDVDLLDEASGPLVVDRLEELGYDGLIIRGFPDPDTTELGRLRAEQSDKLTSLSKEDFEKGYGIVEDYKPRIQAAREAEGIDETLQQSQVLAFRPERQRVRTTRQVSNTEYDARVSDLDSAEDAKTWQTNAEALVKNMRETSPTIRTPELEESAQALRDGKITREQHLKNINTYKPVESWDALPREPSNKATVFSLKPDQREKGRFILPADTTDALGVTQSGLKVGDRFNGRLDIPAYQRFDTWIVAGTSNAEKGVTHYAKAIHYKGVGDKPVRFAASQKTGEKIGTGEMGKTGYATVSGEIKDLDADAIREKAATLLNDPEWTQVGFDPRRQSSFYVRGENNRHVPVREADEVIQIGPLVLAKNAKLDMEYSGYNEGGMAMDEQMDAVFKSSRTGYAEGGEVGAAPDTTIGVDPVSGNEVPMGATPEEVRDDIPAQLSEGEYVVPADVVRFYGVKFFEDLRTEAKQGYAEMDQNGRIGGEPVGPEGMEMIEPEDDLPFDISELQVVDEETGMYVGGLTGYAEGGEVEAAPIPQNPFSNTGSTAGYEIKEYVNDAGEVMYIQFMNGEPMTFIPQGFRPKESVAEQAATGAGVAATSAPTTSSMSAPSGSGSGGGSDGSIGSTGMGDVDAAFTQGASAKDWTKASVEDFASATSNLGSGTRLGSTIAGAINPFLGVATGIGMGSSARNNAYDMLDGIAYQLESGNLSEGQRKSLLDQQAKIQEYLKPSSKDDSPATTLLKGSGIFGGATSLYENLGDYGGSVVDGQVVGDGKRTFGDTWLGDLLGADGKAGVQGPSLSESMAGARRTAPDWEDEGSRDRAAERIESREPSKYQKQMESGNYSGAAKTATNSWVAATNAANSMKDKSGPAYHAAIKAQSDASRAASEAIRKASGWTGGFFGKATNPNWRDEDKDDDK